MKIEEFKKMQGDYNSQIINLRSKLTDLETEYIKYSPFKISDMVEVVANGKKIICFIGAIEISYTGEYRYKFMKPKKDGTMGGQSASIYYAESITLLNKYQEVKVSDTTKADSSNSD